MLEVVAGLEDRGDLLGREDLRQHAALLLVRHARDRPVGLAQARPVEEAQGAGGLVEGREADLALRDQVALVGLDVLGCDDVEGLVDIGPAEIPAEQPEHQRVCLLGPRTAAVGGQGVGEELLEIGLLHVFLLVAGCDLEEAMTDEPRYGRRSRPDRNLRRVAALVQQADAADEARPDRSPAADPQCSDRRGRTPLEADNGGSRGGGSVSRRTIPMFRSSLGDLGAPPGSHAASDPGSLPTCRVRVRSTVRGVQTAVRERSGRRAKFDLAVGRRRERGSSCREPAIDADVLRELHSVQGLQRRRSAFRALIGGSSTRRLSASPWSLAATRSVPLRIGRWRRAHTGRQQGTCGVLNRRPIGSLNVCASDLPNGIERSDASREVRRVRGPNTYQAPGCQLGTPPLSVLVRGGVGSD